MKSESKRTWALIRLLNQANEEIGMLGGIPGAPLDTRAWLDRHLQLWPQEFAYDDWSSYRPAMRKICLRPFEYGIREEEC